MIFSRGYVLNHPTNLSERTLRPAGETSWQSATDVKTHPVTDKAFSAASVTGAASLCTAPYWKCQIIHLMFSITEFANDFSVWSLGSWRQWDRICRHSCQSPSPPIMIDNALTRHTLTQEVTFSVSVLKSLWLGWFFFKYVKLEVSLFLQHFHKHFRFLCINQVKLLLITVQVYRTHLRFIYSC